ncbi:MAG: hypothetical protein NDJ92_13690 [Thermoanaerobaculia bacterium]|nr:hypothetical protein [Thermoanaerobaculia bacterium]
MTDLKHLFAALILATIPATAGAQGSSVTHTPPGCFPDRCRSMKIVAEVTGTERVDQVVLYFNADGLSEDYYTTMRPSNGNAGSYWGYIPVALEGVEKVNYRIEAIDASGRRVATEGFKVEVRTGCAAPELTEEEKQIARNLVIGYTKPDQKAIPPGFRCGGIVALVNAQGEMMPNEECREKLARNGDDLLCPIAWKKSALVMAGGAAVGAVIITENDQDEDPLVPLSTARP